MGAIMAETAFHLLINSDSATAHALGREKIEAAIQESGIDIISFDYLAAAEFKMRLHALLDSPYTILVGGGDGTIAMSSALHIERKKPFGIIPMGTMNLLAGDLHLPLDFLECLKAYKETQSVAIDVGILNDRLFLCCASWGTMPEASKFREENRGQPHPILFARLIPYIFKQMDKAFKKRIKLTMDGHTRSIRTAMLIVSNNLYDKPSIAAPFKKGSLQDGLLGVYKISPRGPINKIRLLMNLKMGLWKNDPFIHEYKARHVKVDTRRQEDLISLDGEPMKLKGPYNISLMRQALPVILPRASAEAL